MLKFKSLILTLIAVVVLLTFLPNAAYAYSGTGTINCSPYLNLRESPSTSAKILDKLYSGTKVTIVDSLDGWYKISIGSKTGWVSDAYVSLESNATFKRMQGTDRYSTALEISKAGWQVSENVIIATGESFPDALCSAPLAKLLNSPILLTSKDSLDQEVISEIKRLRVKKAYIIGGQGVISSYIESTLKSMNIEVDRTYGSDRYETSAAVAIKFFTQETQAVVVTGENFPDAISIAPVAAAKEIPILLTKGNTLSESIKNYIKSAGITNTYITGGTGVVSRNIENELPSPKRLGGKDRYETNTQILSFFSDILKSNTIYIATGEDYPDALAGSVLAARNLSPVVLVSDKPKQPTLDFMNKRNLTADNMHILGGNGAVSNSTVKLLLSRSSSNILPPAQLPFTQLVKGIDVSRYQGEIDWNAVKKAGYKFAFIKVTGVSNRLFTDLNALKNVEGAKDAGLAVGGYHFAGFKNIDEAVKEANYFKSVIKDMGLSYAVLDIEYTGAKGDLTQASIKFLDIISDVAQPVLYSYPVFIRSHFNSNITKHPLWLASYSASSPKAPIWPDWQIWQQTSKGSVPGIKGNVDINVMKPEFFIKKS